MKHSHGKCLPAQAPGNNLRLPPDQVCDGQTIKPMAFPDCRTGTNSAMQREDTSAFDMQIEGKLKRFYGGIKWLRDNHVVIPSVVLGRSGVEHAQQSRNFQAPAFSAHLRGRILA